MRIYAVRAAFFALGALSLATLSGCGSQAQMVQKMTSGDERGHQMKMLYAQGSNQGVIQCKVAPDGALSECRRMTVVFGE